MLWARRPRRVSWAVGAHPAGRRPRTGIPEWPGRWGFSLRSAGASCSARGAAGARGLAGEGVCVRSAVRNRPEPLVQPRLSACSQQRPPVAARRRVFTRFLGGPRRGCARAVQGLQGVSTQPGPGGTFRRFPLGNAVPPPATFLENTRPASTSRNNNVAKSGERGLS